MANWYTDSAKYTLVTSWAASTSYSVGDIRRQLATPAVGNERVFRCTTAGTSGSGEPTWTLTAGGTTADNTATWTEITGQAIYNGDGGGTAWAAPHARLGNAFAWGAAGDTFYVGGTHAATQSTNLTLTNPGTAASPCNVLCVSNAASPPTTLATTASEAATASANLTIGGYGYYYGLVFNCGTGTGLGNLTCGNNLPYASYFDACTFAILSNQSGTMFMASNGSTQDAYMECRNCSFVFGSTTQQITVDAGLLNLIGCSFAQTGPVPAYLFKLNICGFVRVRDSDLSKITGALVSVSQHAYTPALFENCKLAAGVAATTGTFTSIGGGSVKMHNCSNSAVNYAITEKNYNGTLVQETTVVRTGGASDGTTPLSWNMTSTANSKFTSPFVSPEIVQWNDASGSAKTVTVEVAGNATLTNGEIWLTVEYPGDSASPQGAVASSRKADILASAANVTTSAASWGGSTTAQQKLQVTFTPQMKGPIKARVHLAKAGATVYVDPILTIV